MRPGSFAGDPGVTNQSDVGFFDTVTGEFRNMTLSGDKIRHDSGQSKLQHKHQQAHNDHVKRCAARRELDKHSLKTDDPDVVLAHYKILLGHPEILAEKMRRRYRYARYALLHALLCLYRYSWLSVPVGHNLVLVHLLDLRGPISQLTHCMTCLGI